MYEVSQEYRKREQSEGREALWVRIDSRMIEHRGKQHGGDKSNKKTWYYDAKDVIEIEPIDHQDQPFLVPARAVERPLHEMSVSVTE